MQITADISKILKTVQHGLTFILNILSESRTHFAFIKNEAVLPRIFESWLSNILGVTKRNYAGACKGICSYSLMYNFLI